MQEVGDCSSGVAGCNLTEEGEESSHLQQVRSLDWEGHNPDLEVHSLDPAVARIPDLEVHSLEVVDTWEGKDLVGRTEVEAHSLRGLCNQEHRVVAEETVRGVRIPEVGVEDSKASHPRGQILAPLRGPL